MNGLTTVTTKGQVTIPEEVRLALGIKIGDRVLFDEITPPKKQATMKIISPEIVESLFGALKTSVKFRGRRYEREATRKLIAGALR